MENVVFRSTQTSLSTFPRFEKDVCSHYVNIFRLSSPSNRLDMQMLRSFRSYCSTVKQEPTTNNKQLLTRSLPHFVSKFRILMGFMVGHTRTVSQATYIKEVLFHYTMISRGIFELFIIFACTKNSIKRIHGPTFKNTCLSNLPV